MLWNVYRRTIQAPAVGFATNRCIKEKQLGTIDLGKKLTERKLKEAVAKFDEVPDMRYWHSLMEQALGHTDTGSFAIDIMGAEAEDVLISLVFIEVD